MINEMSIRIWRHFSGKFTNTSRHILISHFNFYFVFISGGHLPKVKFSVPLALMTSPGPVISTDNARFREILRDHGRSREINPKLE